VRELAILSPSFSVERVFAAQESPSTYVFCLRAGRCDFLFLHSQCVFSPSRSFVLGTGERLRLLLSTFVVFLFL